MLVQVGLELALGSELELGSESVLELALEWVSVLEIQGWE